MQSARHLSRFPAILILAAFSFKWNGTTFGAQGVGGVDSPVFPSGSFQNCQAPAQLRFGSSISHVDETQQYLLTFVCDSPGDPALGQSSGSAWFYSTSDDLSDPRQWTPPREIAGSWAASRHERRMLRLQRVLSDVHVDGEEAGPPLDERRIRVLPLGMSDRRDPVTWTSVLVAGIHDRAQQRAEPPSSCAPLMTAP
jgi:hypothetical protein